MAFDINPLSFIGDIYQTGKAQKWWKLLSGCAVAAFLGFWGGFSVAGGAWLAAHDNVGLALAWGVLVGTGTMAASVAMTVQKQKMWQDLGIAIPKGLQTVLEQTDVEGPPTPSTK